MFLDYAIQGFIDGLNEQLLEIRKQQINVHWINYIHSMFKDRDRETDIRRRRLIIDLSDCRKPIPIGEINHISPRIAEAYANKTSKTIRRDLAVLNKMGLIELTKKDVRAKVEQILFYIPREKKKQK